MNLTNTCWAEARQKREYTLWSHWHASQEKAKLLQWKADQWLLWGVWEVGMEGGDSLQRTEGSFWDDGNILNHDFDDGHLLFILENSLIYTPKSAEFYFLLNTPQQKWLTVKKEKTEFAV